MNFIQKKSFQQITYWKLGSNIFGRPRMYVHCFLLDGLLIDTGQPHVRKELSAALKNETIHRILLTHHHEDHSGNVEAIKALKKVKAYASPLCCEIMKNPSQVEPARWATWGQHTKAELIPLKEKTIQTEHFNFEILATPGHAIDQISLYEPNQGWLFSGDLFVHDYIKVFMRDENIGEQITSIKKLLRLDFDVMLCNHQPVFSEGKKRLQNKLQFLEDFYGKVKTEYEKGKDVKGIMQTLGFKENRFLVWFSLGQLSRKNMVRSVIQTIEREKVK